MRDSLPAGTSWYLDLIRGLAAVGVLVGHAGQGFFSSGLGWWFPNGHHLVVIFFVISGFVMSHAVMRLGDDWRAYVGARFSRIVSVAFPALILTVVCDLIGRWLDPSLYARVARSDGYWVRIALSMVFLQQSGPFCASPGSNTPFWSLAYEAWYYVLLGVCSFIGSKRKRIAAVLLVAMAAGPKILILLPVWFAGLEAHRISTWVKMSLSLAVAGSGLTLGIILSVLLKLFHLPGELAEWQAGPPWFFSGGFLADYQLGITVAIHLVATDQLFRMFPKWKAKCGGFSAVRFMADRSFSLYAYHMPLLCLISVIVPYQKGNSVQVMGAISIVYSVVLLLHWFTERKRNTWRMLVAAVLNAKKSAMPPRRAAIESDPV